MFVLGAGCVYAGGDTAVTARLKAELKESHPYVPPPPAAEAGPETITEPVFKLETMSVSLSRAFTVDVLAEARRAAAAREAEQFSLVKGGTLLSFRHGDVGFWPTVVPATATPVKKPDAMLVIDLLRIKW